MSNVYVPCPKTRDRRYHQSPHGLSVVCQSHGFFHALPSQGVGESGHRDERLYGSFA
jgi:hypothetical protein